MLRNVYFLATVFVLTLTFTGLLTTIGLAQDGNDKVVALFHFENVQDSGPRQLHGKLWENASIVNHGKIGKCLQLTGLSGFQANREQSISTVDNEFSIVAWVKLPKQVFPIYIGMSGFMGEFAYGSDTGGVFLSILPSGNLEGFFLKIEGAELAAEEDIISKHTNVSDNEWHHIAYTKYAGTHTLFVDGAIIERKRISGNPGFVGDRTSVGTAALDPRTGEGVASIGDVLIDEIGFFEKGFSPDEISEIYHHGLPSQQPFLLTLTEYMVRDWSKSSGGGLPQWIELYNPTPNPILLQNCVFNYVAIVNFNRKVKQVQIPNFVVPAEEAVIFVTHAVPARHFGGITAEQVYDLQIENVLKRGWSLTTANGDVISKAGEAFEAYRPIAPKHSVDGERQSYTRYTETDTETAYFYGSASDIGTPGYHAPLAPAAPSLLRHGFRAFLPTKPVDPREKAATTWGALKQSEK